MTVNGQFAQELTKYVQRDGRHARQLSAATAERFGAAGQIPHNTLSRWLRGDVSRPRHWRDLLRLAAVLRLSRVETDLLLGAAGHEGLDALRALAGSEEEAALLAIWAEPASVSRPLSPPFQAPPQIVHFTGREAEIRQIKSLLGLAPPFVATTGRLFCLQGMGGVGKTSLAIHLAYALRPHFPDGVLWAGLAQAHPMALLHNFASAYGYDASPYTDLESRSSKVREWLAGKDVLIILDDVPDDRVVRPLLPPSGRCAVILTTRRNDLAVADMGHRIPLPSFATNGAESLALFGNILGRATVQQEREHFLALAELLGGLPLALQIAANRIRHEPEWTAVRFLSQLRNEMTRLSLLERGDQAVRLSFSVSYRRLPLAMQRFFTALGVFAADFAAPAAAQVAGVPLEAATGYLETLQALSLMDSQSAGRYHLHPLLRDFAREQWADDRPARRMTTYYMDFLAAHERDFSALDAEAENLLAALATTGREEARFLQGATLIYPYLRARGQYEQATELLTQAEAIARRRSDGMALAPVLHHLGHLANKQGMPEQAADYFQEALVLARQNGDEALTAGLLMKLGALAHRQGRFAEAESYYREAKGLTERRGDSRRLVAILINLGLLHAVQGRPEAAEAAYGRALLLAREANDKALTLTALQNLGSLVEERGDYAQARSYYWEGYQLARQTGDPELRSRLLGNLGLVACALGNHAEAGAYFREGLRLAESAGLRLQMSRQQANLGQVACQRRDYTAACNHYQAALVLARELGFPGDVGTILNGWGECCLAQRDFAGANAAFEEALALVRAVNLRQETATSLYGLARAAAGRGNLAEARQLAEESLALFKAIEHHKCNEVKWWLAELPSPMTSVE